jgi:hypothetical protein
VVFVFEIYAYKHISCPYKTPKLNHRIYKNESRKFWYTTKARFVVKHSIPTTCFLLGKDPLKLYKLVIGTLWKFL